MLNFELGTNSDIIAVNSGTVGVTRNFANFCGFAPGTDTLVNYATASDANQSGAGSIALGTAICGYTYTLATVVNTLRLTASAIASPPPTQHMARRTVLAPALHRQRCRA